MKILHLRASNFYGGPERQLHLHAREALGSDCEVGVASFIEDGHSPDFLESIARDGIPTHSFDVRSAYDPRSVGLVREYLDSQSIDLLCTHDYRSAVVGWLAVRGSAARWIAFSRGWTTEDLKVRAYNWIDRLVTHRARHVVAVSEAQKRKLERLRIPARKISVVPNAIDPELMLQGEPVDLRARYGFGPETFIGVSGGRFSGEKGQVYLVDAAIRALESEPRLRVVLFGDGPDRSAMLERIAEADATDRVLCPGFERNMPGCIRGADLLINPSLSEGMPNIVLEAMGVGVPVLATAVGGVPEIIEDGVSGRLVPPADAEALRVELLDHVRAPQTGREHALRARRFADEQLGFGRQFERMREAYVKGMANHG